MGKQTHNEKAVICPVCKENELETEMEWNALSRKDGKTYICNDCGLAEAFTEMGM